MLRRLMFVALLALALSLALVGVVAAVDTGTKQVGVVIAFPDGAAHTEVVTVPITATAFDVLKAAKINLVSQTSSFGPAVCAINNVGCPATNCFCDPKQFWAYYHLNGNAWAVAAEGASAHVPANGAVEGFVWSGMDAKFNPTSQPPVVTFAQITAAPKPLALPKTGGSGLWLIGSGLGGLLLAAAGLALNVLGRRSRTMKRFTHSTLLVVVLAAAVWLLPLERLSPAAAAQEGPPRAALVVRFADGAVETRCVSFSEPAISGADLLARSGLPVIVNSNSGLGGAVCSIKGQGCAFPSQDCFCRCQGSACEYWAYYHLSDGRWVYSDVGAGNYQVSDGAVEGWSWGKGNFTSGTEPPAARFADICTAPVAAAAVTGPTAAGAAANPAGPDRSAALGQAPAAVYALGDPASLPRYASFLLFVAALAGGWAWMLTRRKRELRATEASSRGSARRVAATSAKSACAD